MTRTANLQNAPTILIIDADRCIRLMLAEVTRSAGYAPLLASGPGEGLAAAAGGRVDLIMADTASPDAKEALRALRAGLLAGGQARDVPVVLLTSAGHRLKASELAGLGVQLILSKPLSTRELLAGVAELLDAAEPARREAA